MGKRNEHHFIATDLLCLMVLVRVQTDKHQESYNQFCMASNLGQYFPSNCPKIWGLCLKKSDSRLKKK